MSASDRDNVLNASLALSEKSESLTAGEFIVRCALSWILLVMMVANLMAQTDEVDDMKMMEDVSQLQQQLAAQSIPQREDAEKKLLEIGVIALNYLPGVDDSMTTDMKTRLGRIRTELETRAVVLVTNPSRIKLSGKYKLEDLFQEVNRQTGNEIVIPEQMTVETAEQQIQFEESETEFWQLIDKVQSTTKLTIDSYGGRPNALQFRENFVADAQGMPVLSTLQPIVTYSSILRFEITRVDSTRNLLQPAMDQTNFTMLIRWEPRLRPISVDLPMKSLTVVDEFDKTYQFEENDQVFYGSVQPEFPELEYAISMPLIDRQVEEIKSLSGTVSAVLPGRMESFEFPKITTAMVDSAQTKAGATVTFRGIEKNEDLLGVRVSLGFEEDNNALESHRSWGFQNELFLQKADGTRIDYIGSESYQQTNTELGVMYLFAEIPDDAKLVYCTPAAIVKVEIPFKLVKIRLP